MRRLFLFLCVISAITVNGYGQSKLVTETMSMDDPAYINTQSLNHQPINNPNTFTTTGDYMQGAVNELAGSSSHLIKPITNQLKVLQAFPNNGWSAHTALPAGRWATSPVFSKACMAGTDTGFIYLISGGDDAFANSALNSRYNTATGTWTNKSPIPTSRTQITPVQVKNKIYVIGGYAGSFSPTTINSVYDLETDTWTLGSPLPTAVGDYAIGVYGDSLIYVVGGYTGAGDVSIVQIFHINSNTWTTGTIFPGTASAGCRMGIAGNTIVMVGGYSQSLASPLASAFQGVIDPTDPQIITWTALLDYPGGLVGRLGAGVSFENDNRVYFCGGDPDGGGTSVKADIYAFNTASSEWETGPNMITGVSNISGLVGIVNNNTRYLVTMGGYNGSLVVTSNEWLELGPALPQPYAQVDTFMCEGSAIMLQAFDGTEYTWSPSSGLSDSTIANPMASPIDSTIYTVLISKAYGCPVMDTVVVAVNGNPVLTTQSTDALCFGNSDGSGTAIVVGSSYYVYNWTSGGDSSFVNLPAGHFEVTVTDTVTGCYSTDSVMIEEPTALTVTVENDTTSGCFGSLIAVVSGGTPPYSYLWNDPGAQTTDTATNLCSSTYVVQVTDSNGCPQSATADVILNVGIESVENLSVAVYPNPVSEILNFTASLSAAYTTLNLVDVLGQQVMLLDEVSQSGHYAATFNLAALPAGIYFLQLTEGNTVVSVTKIIRQ